MEMIAGKLSKECEQRWITLGRTILQRRAEIYPLRWIGRGDLFRNDESISFAIIFAGWFKALWSSDGRFQGIVRKIRWMG